MSLVVLPTVEAPKNDRRERMIWCAVIYQAIKDKRGGCKRAARWLSRADGQFVGLCESLNLNPKALRERAEEDYELLEL